MKPFEYARPETLDELLSLLAQHGPNAMVLAGGTDVIVRLRAGRTPSVIVDLKRVKALSSEILDVDSSLRIGARAVMTDIANDERVRRHFPALVESANVVGSVQIRNRATLAGNICNASPAADTAPALLVYGAKVSLVSAGEKRMVPLANFFTGPGRTVMNLGEIVESIDLPIPKRPAGAAFGRITRRRGVDLATINLCCRVDAEGEVLFAFGAVAPKPFIVKDETRVLANPRASESAKNAALEKLIAHSSPLSNVRGSREYRLAMLQVVSRRALASAIERLQAMEKTR